MTIDGRGNIYVNTREHLNPTPNRPVGLT